MVFTANSIRTAKERQKLDAGNMLASIKGLDANNFADVISQETEALMGIAHLKDAKFSSYARAILSEASRKLMMGLCVWTGLALTAQETALMVNRAWGSILLGLYRGDGIQAEKSALESALARMTDQQVSDLLVVEALVHQAGLLSSMVDRSIVQDHRAVTQVLADMPAQLEALSRALAKKALPIQAGSDQMPDDLDEVLAALGSDLDRSLGVLSGFNAGHSVNGAGLRAIIPLLKTALQICTSRGQGSARVSVPTMHGTRAFDSPSQDEATAQAFAHDCQRYARKDELSEWELDQASSLPEHQSLYKKGPQ